MNWTELNNDSVVFCKDKFVLRRWTQSCSLFNCMAPIDILLTLVYMSYHCHKTILKMFMMWQLIYKINSPLGWCYIVNFLQIYSNVWSFAVLDTNQCSFSTSHLWQHHVSLSTHNVCFLKLTLLWGQIYCNRTHLDPKPDTVSEVPITRVPDLTSLWSYPPFRSVFISLTAESRKQEQDWYINY